MISASNILYVSNMFTTTTKTHAFRQINSVLTETAPHVNKQTVTLSWLQYANSRPLFSQSMWPVK